MESILRGLNVAQRAAVTSSASVLQVLAPPGSGKTKTLTSRVAYLLAHHGYAPWNVICCTFTIKASREMRERLHGMIGGDLESKLVLGTFHSICRRYLVSYGHLIGIPKNFGIADSDDSLGIIKRAVKRLKLSIDPKSARSRISHRKARGKRLDDVLKSNKKNAEAQDFATIFREYEDALKTSNLLDYDDLLLRCVDLLTRHPECVADVEALLIDEFQDTNVVQFELMKLLASAKKRITIVGDPDQSIYGFRSAEIENLHRMRAHYPDTVVINLEENYRSSSAVLKLAQEVIEQDVDRPDKKLKSTQRYGTLPVLRRLPNPHEEALWIVSEIKRMTTMTGGLICHGDIAILLRSAFLSLLIEKALANAAIPYRMVGGRRFFDRVEVRLLLDYLRTVSHPDNTSALLSIINTPARKVGDTTVKELVRVSEIHKESLWSTTQKVLLGRVALEKKLAKPAEQGLRALVFMIEKARQKIETLEPKETPGKLLEHIITSLRYQEYLKRQYPEDHEERWENVKELLTQATDATLQFTTSDTFPSIDGTAVEVPQNAYETLAQFLANVVLSTEKETSEDGTEKPRVTISTIHSAKGLEWPVVFVPAIYEGSIPHSRAEDTSEERRLLYVALTRAQALLYMTFPVMQSRDESESILSQFLPSKTTHLVSQIGPVFGDKVVEDIRTILRRTPVSQEAIVRGMQSIKDNESQFDDVWPIDGSHRRAHLAEREYPSFILQPGQSLSDALKSTGQRSNFSTKTYSVSTTMTNTASFSTASISTGFTTANNHLKSNPQAIDRPAIKPSLIKSASEGSGIATKKLTLARSSTNQGNIASFFSNSIGQSTLRPSNSTADLEREIRNHRTKAESRSNTHEESRMSHSTPTISADLLQHKLPKASATLSRPKIYTDDGSANSTNQTRKRSYHHYLSSPPPPESVKVCVLDDSDLAANSNPHNPSNSNVNLKPSSTTIPSSTTMHKTTMSMLKSNTPLHNPISTTLNPISRLTGLNTLNKGLHVSSSSENGPKNVSASGLLNHANFTNTIARKTLGVRRSMKGWDNRKNKKKNSVSSSPSLCHYS